MVKYADSFEETITLTAAGDAYSVWFDVSWANELYMYATVTFAQTKGGGKNESLTVLEVYRHSPDGVESVVTKISAFSPTSDASTIEEEEYAGADIDAAGIGAWNKLGTRVRFKMTATGDTWTANQSISAACTIYAKRN